MRARLTPWRSSGVAAFGSIRYKLVPRSTWYLVVARPTSDRGRKSSRSKGVHLNHQGVHHEKISAIGCNACFLVIRLFGVRGRVRRRGLRMGWQGYWEEQ